MVPQWLKTEDKGYSGSSRSPNTATSPILMSGICNGPEVNWNSVKKEDTSTGRLLSPSGRRSLSGAFESCSDRTTPSLQGAQPPMNTAGRMTPESKAPNSSSGPNRYKETRRSTGIVYGMPPKRFDNGIDGEGNIMEIPTHIRFQSYRTIRQISADYAEPLGMERSCHVFWGRTGTGKSRKAWEDAGMDAYPKDPRTKFWCGYRGQANVIIDEFCGGIDISHMLRWVDRYPVIVEIKGGSRCLNASNYWITSNIDPRNWYPEATEEQKEALMRRLKVTHFDSL